MNDSLCKKSYNKAELVAIVGVMAAFAAILSYIEALIPINIWIPGVKLGLANIAVVTVMYLYGSKKAFVVNFIRIIVVGLLFGSLFSISFSLAGAIVSYLSMVVAKKTDLFTIIGVSVIGGVAHNLGQALVASWVIDSYNVMYYVPALMFAGIITGIIIGIIGKIVTRYMEVILKKKRN